MATQGHNRKCVVQGPLLTESNSPYVSWADSIAQCRISTFLVPDAVHFAGVSSRSQELAGTLYPR